ncbi:MAG TPA: YbjN domain-containing protein [Bradyrhizobium sp.]|nr:YbjN domain-containing protein [Bradyrhizobium sp.]
MSDPVITSLSLERLRDILQEAGYRVETQTDPVANVTYLRSATNGLGFEVRPGNMAGNEFIDIVLVAVLQVQGNLPLDLVNRWNALRRFARLQLSVPFLALTLDVSVAGGVAPNHLRAQIEIWDHLVRDLIVYLREELPKIAALDPDAAKAEAGEPDNASVEPAARNS